MQNAVNNPAPAAKPPTPHLNRYYHFTEAMRDPRIAITVSRKVSRADGKPVSEMVMRPADGKPERVFFFFHGMDGDCGDAVVARKVVTDLNAAVVSLGGRGPCWLSDGFIADAENAIKAFGRGFAGFYMLGISMGGTQALSLASMLPKQLRKKLMGIMAMIPGADLERISRESAHERVRRTVKASVANRGILRERSPIELVSSVPESAPYLIFYNRNDDVLLAGSTAEYIKALSKTNPVEVYSDDANHSFLFDNFDYAKAFKALGGRSLKGGPPPLIKRSR